MDNTTETKLSSGSLHFASEVMRALAHPKRLSILGYIANHSPACVNDIYTGLRMEQSVTSQHLRVLRMANLVETTREGKFVYYKINKAHLQRAGEVGKALANLDK